MRPRKRSINNALKFARQAMNRKKEKTPKTRYILVYSPKKSCFDRKAAQPNRATPASPACVASVQTHTCNWRTLLCVRPCHPCCRCHYPKKSPPPLSWPAFIRKNLSVAFKAGIVVALLKISFDHGVWGGMDGTMELRRKAVEALAEFFSVKAPDKRTEDEKYEMERFQYNWKSAFNYFVKKFAKDFAHGPKLIAEIINEKLINLLCPTVPEAEPKKGDKLKREEPEGPVECPKPKPEKKKKGAEEEGDVCKREPIALLGANILGSQFGKSETEEAELEEEAASEEGETADSQSAEGEEGQTGEVTENEVPEGGESQEAESGERSPTEEIIESEIRRKSEEILELRKSGERRPSGEKSPAEERIESEIRRKSEEILESVERRKSGEGSPAKSEVKAGTRRKSESSRLPEEGQKAARRPSV